MRKVHLFMAVGYLVLPVALLAQAPSPEQVTLGPYDTEGSVTVGYRFTDVGGREQKFTELFNLRQGFRVMDFNMTGRTAEGIDIFADSFSIHASGLGGDPFAGGQFTLKKDKLYDLRVNYRQSYYYWDRNDAVLAPAPPGPPQLGNLTTNHDWATVRRFGSANLTINATNSFRLLFEYSRNSRRGVNYTTRTLEYFGMPSTWESFIRSNPYYLEAPLYDHGQRFTGGFAFSPRTWSLHYRLGYQSFGQVIDWDNVTSPQQTINPTKTPAQNAGELLNFARWRELRDLNSPVSEFSVRGRPHRRLDVRGGYMFYRYGGPASMQAVFDGSARTPSGSPAPFAPYHIEYRNRADLTEPNHIADGGASVAITDWWNVHADYRYSRFTLDSLASFHTLRDRTQVIEGEEEFEWKHITHQMDLNLEFLPKRGLIVRPGVRFMRRDIEVLADGTLDPLLSRRINTAWPILGAFYQPSKKFSVRGDIQTITNGASYTRISPHTELGGRVVFRFKPTEKLTVEDHLVLRNRKFLETEFDNTLRLNAVNIAYDLNERLGIYGGFSYDSWFATASVVFIRGTEPRSVTWRDQTVNRVWTAGLAVKPMPRLGFNFSGNYVRTTGAGEISGEPPYFGPLTWPMATGTLYYDFPKAGRLSIDLQRTYYLEEIIRGNDFQASILAIRWTRDF